MVWRTAVEGGIKYYKSGFHTPEDAYYKGRLELERNYLHGGKENETKG